ncbi:MAG: phosphatidate cytidylyltransferase [Deltaproteobacteria bacterium]|nr:phosphatidate cytidylyltransferase [Deltaproteobacteria bacterium]MCB9788098.1 phosphatidate cytidylyltransferase [Deltaproteobacteria bacterium]
MLTRIATGLVLAPLIIWLVLAGPTWGVLLFLWAAGVLAAYELLAMAMPGRRAEIALGVLLVALGLALWAPGLAGYVGGSRSMSEARVGVARFFGMAWPLAPGLLVLARPRPLETAGHRLMALYGGTAFILVTFGAVLSLGTSPPALMVSFAIVWLGDTGAYFAGRALGRHKLYELISPKKTIEGAVGGLLASVLGAWAMAAWIYPTLPLWKLITAAVVGGVVAQCGDLVESAFKRSYGVKDSGKLLPGHGGVLDRLDGFLFAAPVLAVLLV